MQCGAAVVCSQERSHSYRHLAAEKRASLASVPSFPAEQCYQAMAALMRRAAGRMPAIAFHVVAEYARPHHLPHMEPILAYCRQWLSSLPLLGAMEVQQDGAPEHRVWVPMELLQALTAVCPGLKASSK